MAYQIIKNAKIGWQLGLAGFNFIKNHKATLFFSFFSWTLFLLLFLFFLVPFIGPTTTEKSLLQHALLTFLFLFLTTTFSIWMKISLSIYANALFEKNPISTLTSTARALQRFFTILQWAFIDAVIGTIAGALRTRNNNEGIIISLISSLIGTTLEAGWNILSFFVIPVLAFENLSLFATIKESGNILKKTWGPSVGVAFNTGLIGVAWLLGWYLLFFGPFMFYCKYFLIRPVPQEKALILTIIAMTACILPLFVLGIVLSTVKIIIKTALFNYTRNKPTGPFETGLLKISFAPTASKITKELP